MRSSLKLDLNIKTLKWARENAGFDYNVHPFSENRIKKLENGTDKLTLKEANQLAKIYGVSCNIFYLSPPEERISNITDFRKLPATQNQKYSKELRFLINKLRYRQNWLSDYFKEKNIKALSFVNSFNLRSKPQDVADKIIKTFFKSRSEYLNFHKELNNRKKTKEKLLTSFMQKLGDFGIITLKCKGLENDKPISLKEIRGVVLIDKYAPFIFIHSEDHVTAQIFTLMHELAHIFIGKEGVSGELRKESHHRVELFCNKVASRVLLTEKEFKKYFQKNMDEDQLTKTIKTISNKFFISKLSLLLRLKGESIVSVKTFNKLWKEYTKEMKNYLLKKKEKLEEQKENGNSSGHYYNTKLSRTNREFVRIVSGAYRAKNITGMQASSLLDVKLDNLKKLYIKAG